MENDNINLSYKSGQIEKALVSCKLGVLLGQNRLLESLEDLSTRVRFGNTSVRHLNSSIFKAIVDVNSKDFDKKLVERVIQQLPERNSSLHSFSSCYNLKEEQFFDDICQSTVPKVAEVAQQGLKLIRSSQQFWSETSLF